MRIAYLDEAGISDREPIAVQAAVVIDSDRHIKGVEVALSELADSCAPPECRAGFIFHAKELYHGGKTLKRDAGHDHGRGFLKSLLHIPADNGMEVAMHFIEKAGITDPRFIPDKAKDRAILYHTMAFIGCVVGIEMLMRSRYPKEVCHLVAENNTETRAAVRKAHNFLKTKESIETLPPNIRGVLPLQHIVDTVFFADKAESSALQLADACAFAIRRHLERRDDAAEYYGILIPALISRPSSPSD